MKEVMILSYKKNWIRFFSFFLLYMNDKIDAKED